MRKLMMTVAMMAAVAMPVLAVTNWQIEPTASKLTWSTSFNKQPVSGEFKTWTGAIAFDEAKLAESSLRIDVQLGSVESGDAERDSALKSADFFNTAATPVATFVSKDIRKTPQGYEAVGTLSLAGVSRPLVVPFKLTVTGGKALAQGQFALSRKDFGIGKGQWASAGEIADAVQVTFTLHANGK